MQDNALADLAQRYVWWKSPEEAHDDLRRLAIQVMNLGDFDDVQRLLALVGEDYLADVLRTAEAGDFEPRSWHYWHYRLGLATDGTVPPLPQRFP
ncbi:MAG: hypothetical protein NZ585_12805 [Chloracidobacterium sp.]|nr:hypothetical protein [Chloracidobacterium sp.]MDW8217833.1 hypothetical protein [Acidobacteriota bacterium]